MSNAYRVGGGTYIFPDIIVTKKKRTKFISDVTDQKFKSTTNKNVFMTEWTPKSKSWSWVFHIDTLPDSRLEFSFEIN